MNHHSTPFSRLSIAGAQRAAERILTNCYTILLCALLLADACAAKNISGPLRLTLPDEFYAVVGSEMSIYYDNIVLTETPEKYPFEVKCDIGRAESNRWTVTPA